MRWITSADITRWVVQALAGLGAMLMCAGAFFAISAPGDGQTAMFVYPLWLLGVLPMAIAGVLTFGRRAMPAAKEARGFVVAMVLLAACSVFGSFLATKDYELRQPKAANQVAN